MSPINESNKERGTASNSNRAVYGSKENSIVVSNRDSDTELDKEDKDDNLLRAANILEEQPEASDPAYYSNGPNGDDDNASRSTPFYEEIPS